MATPHSFYRWFLHLLYFVRVYATDNGLSGLEERTQVRVESAQLLFRNDRSKPDFREVIGGGLPLS
jgi:hypothetical protein